MTGLDMTILRYIKKLALNPPKEREEQTERARQRLLNLMAEVVYERGQSTGIRSPTVGAGAA